MRLRVGLLGTPPREWASLRRTYDCYRRALERDFELRLPDTAREAARLSLDAVVGFWGAEVWAMGSSPGPPRMVCLNGGAVVNYPHLPALLSTLTDHDAILCNCASDEAVVDSLLARRPRPRTVVLPLPVAATLSPRSRAAARATVGVPADAVVLGFVSRLVPQKGLHYFLRTLAFCRTRLAAPVHGLVVGGFWTGYGLLDYVGDRYRDYVAGLLVRDGLADSVTFRAPSDDDEVLADCYAAMDLLLHPTTSVDENFGYVPVEALACARPALVCAYGGLKDTVAGVHDLASVPTWSTSTGIRFDDPAMRRQAVLLLRDEGVREDLVASGQDMIARRHTFTAFADHLAGAVRDLARQHREGGPPVAARANPPPTTHQVSHLPRTDPDWARLRPAVDRYVSRSTSAMGASGGSFHPWPGLEHRGGVCVIHDPAWPGTVPLTADQAEALHDPRSSGAAALRSLLESGLLAWSERPDVG